MTSTQPPIQKMKQGMSYSKKEKTIILNVFKYFSITHPDKCVTELVRRTAKATGCSEKSIFQFRKEEGSPAGFKEPSKTKIRRNPNINSRDMKYDQNVRNSIRTVVYDLRYRNITPSLNTILKQVNQNPNLPNFSLMTLRRLLFDMGFYYEKDGNKSILRDKTSSESKENSNSNCNKNVPKSFKEKDSVNSNSINNSSNSRNNSSSMSNSHSNSNNINTNNITDNNVNSNNVTINSGNVNMNSSNVNMTSNTISMSSNNVNINGTSVPHCHIPNNVSNGQIITNLPQVSNLNVNNSNANCNNLLPTSNLMVPTYPNTAQNIPNTIWHHPDVQIAIPPMHHPHPHNVPIVLNPALNPHHHRDLVHSNHTIGVGNNTDIHLKYDGSGPPWMQHQNPMVKQQ